MSHTSSGETNPLNSKDQSLYDALGRVGLVYANHLQSGDTTRVADQNNFFAFGEAAGVSRIHCGKGWRQLVRQYSEAREPQLWPEDFDPLGLRLAYHRGANIKFTDEDGSYTLGYKTVAARRRALESSATDLDYTGLLSYLNGLRHRTREAPKTFEEVLGENIRTGQSAISTAKVVVGVWCKFAEDGLSFTRARESTGIYS
jgi:hypothetical protein